MAFIEPLDVFYAGEFASAATWNGTPISGIFDEPYGEALEGVEGLVPTLKCKAASVPGVAHNDTIVVDGRTFKVRNVQPDLTGDVVLLRLEAQ